MNFELSSKIWRIWRSLHCPCIAKANWCNRERWQRIQWRQRLGNFGGWIDAKEKVSWGTKITQWGPGAKIK